jgi:PAS domain S-box-containing protein
MNRDAIPSFARRLWPGLPGRGNEQPMTISLAEQNRLTALASYDLIEGAADPALDALTRLATYVLHVPSAAISIVDGEHQWFLAQNGLLSSGTAREQSFSGHVVSLEQSVVVADTHGDPRFSDNPLVLGPEQVRAYAGYPLRSPDGFVLGALCVFDHTPRTFEAHELDMLQILADQVMVQLELRRKTQLLADEQSRLQTVLSAAPDAIIAVDQAGIVRDANPATQTVLGFPRDELVGQDWARHIAVGTSNASPGNELMSGERRAFGQGSEIAMRRKDGSLIEVELTLGVMRQQGRQHWTAILRDITRRKEAERRLLETLSDLRRSREELGQVLNQLQIGTMALDADGAVSFASDTCARVAAIDVAAAVGQRWEDVLAVDEAGRSAIRAFLRAPVGERTRIEAQIGQGSASRWVEVDVRDDPRNQSARMMFLYDITAVHAMRAELRAQMHGRMIGDSPAMRALYDTIDRVAQGEWTVLIEGETGAGKELVAQAIHRAGARRDGPFIAVNCAGLTESILGSQLFGHRRGAFTGAIADQEGLVEAAHGGTLFLDEIGDVAPPIQSALLRVLQEREVTRIGETRPRKVDVRIVAATNRDLMRRVAEGHFREDLLYRLRGARVTVPPLRERREDIPLLVAAFLAEERVTGGKLVTDVAPEALEKLKSHEWPGNVRELRGVVEHAVINCRGRRIDVCDLPPDLLRTPLTTRTPLPVIPPPGVGEDERTRILAALQRTGGNRARAARLLGIGRATLYRRMSELGIDPGTLAGD